jgi:hypothetical protein
MAKAKKQNKTTESNAGRPTSYQSCYTEQAYKLCLLGATDAELANFFDVCEKTINNWKEDYPEFLQSIKEGKQLADANVANRLYQRALGFEHPSEEIKIIFDQETKQQEVVRVPITKIYAPDTAAAIFWLKNRQKDKWRDKQEVDHTTKGDKIETVTVFRIPDNGRD